MTRNKHIKLFTVILTLSLTLFSLPASAHIFKHFSDYLDLRPTKDSNPGICRVHYHTQQKINDRKEDPTYESNGWMLIMRRGLFKAEVDTAMSQLFRYFMPYSTDVDYVEEQGDYFIGRRKFQDFHDFDDVVKKEGSHLRIKDYELQDDGTLIKGKTFKTFTGLASVVVLAEFFADNDAKYYNFAIQENDTELRLIDFDLEDAFNFDDSPDIEKALVSEFGKELIEMSWYQQEKKMMQKKIAETDFAVIENLIRNNVTVTRLESTIWLYEKILRDPTAYPNKDRAEVKLALDAMRAEKDTSQTVDDIVKELRLRHDRLKEQLNHSPQV